MDQYSSLCDLNSKCIYTIHKYKKLAIFIENTSIYAKWVFETSIAVLIFAHRY